MHTKIEKNYIDTSFGFPVSITQVSFFKEDEEWIADIDYQKLKKIVLKKLALRTFRLSGKQLNFIRLCTGYEIDTFCSTFNLQKIYVLRWKTASHVDLGNWEIEKKLRLFILNEFLKEDKDYAESLQWLEKNHHGFISTNLQLNVSLNERI